MKILRLNWDDLRSFPIHALAGVTRSMAAHTVWILVVEKGASWLGSRQISRLQKIKIGHLANIRSRVTLRWEVAALES